MRSKFVRRAAGAAWWSAIEIVSRTGVQFVVTMVLARLLLPHDFGLAALLMIFTGVGAILVDSGFGTALIQSQKATLDDEATVFTFSLSMAIFLWLLLVLVAPFAADFFHAQQFSPLLRATSIVLIFGGLGAVPDALLTTRLNFRARTMAQLIASGISGVVAIGLALNGFGVWSLVWQLVIASLLRTACLWFYCRWVPRGRFSTSSIRSLGRFGGFMLLSALLNAIYTQIQPLLIGRLFDTRSVGFFTLAQNSQQAPLSLMGGVLTRVGLPVFSSLADKPARMLEALRSILRLSMFVFVPCMVGLAVMAKPLVLVIYGARWLPAAPILSILAIAGILWPLHILNLEAIKAQGRSDLFFRLALVKVTLAIILVFLGSPWGPIGIAWATVVSSSISGAINTYYSWKLLGYGPLAQAAEQVPTLVLSAFAALVGWCILRLMPTGPIAVLPAIAGAAVAYLGMARLFKARALDDLVLFVRALRADKAILPESETPA